MHDTMSLKQHQALSRPQARHLYTRLGKFVQDPLGSWCWIHCLLAYTCPPPLVKTQFNCSLSIHTLISTGGCHCDPAPRGCLCRQDAHAPPRRGVLHCRLEHCRDPQRSTLLSDSGTCQGSVPRSSLGPHSK